MMYWKRAAERRLALAPDQDDKAANGQRFLRELDEAAAAQQISAPAPASVPTLAPAPAPAQAIRTTSESAAPDGDTGEPVSTEESKEPVNTEESKEPMNTEESKEPVGIGENGENQAA
jgi:hypothetical protein